MPDTFICATGRRKACRNPKQVTTLLFADLKNTTKEGQKAWNSTDITHIHSNIEKLARVIRKTNSKELVLGKKAEYEVLQLAHDSNVG